MLVIIRRTYFSDGTNGQLFIDGVFQCYTIELPWLHNRPQVSCIPEGEYFLALRCSAKFGLHLWVKNVECRDLILIHPANNALKELKGCIAPVTELLPHPGTGIRSRKALEKILNRVGPVLQKEKLILSIQKFNDDS